MFLLQEINGINMNIYLLWFNEWEANYVFGVFETKEHAEQWKSFFITNPTKTNYYADMEYYSTRDDYARRFYIEERTVGTLDSNLRIDNLKYLEHLYKDKKDKNG
jgi:hypothetical protein